MAHKSLRYNYDLLLIKIKDGVYIIQHSSVYINNRRLSELT